jgi:hypothetical protein
LALGAELAALYSLSPCGWNFLAALKAMRLAVRVRVLRTGRGCQLPFQRHLLELGFNAACMV